ncbi:MAG: KpsF/GutQ family sugar-phosphate isomerase [Sandaracinaceae bacterium]|nr:KpsF/GutQ family sugar-phosphate isomerase [Sandaracinaceae bacterium]
MQLHLVREHEATARSHSELSPALDPLIAEARDTFEQQAAAVAALARRVDRSFGLASHLLHATEGHVVVCGIGKSGLIGQKLAATFASTGTPSFFVHAAEAFHGDLGMITERDTVLLISYSGETEEIIRLLPHLQARGIPTIGLVGALGSTLAKGVDIALDVSVRGEVCPNNLAPTNSTLAALAMGDALAVSLMRLRDFRPQDFAQLHPGGALGRRLRTRVRDAMRSEDLPFLPPTATLGQCLLAAARGRLGMVIVVEAGQLVGVVCDAALHLAMERHDANLSVPVSEIMRLDPPTVTPSTLLAEAERVMAEERHAYLVVVEGGRGVVGVLDRVRD